MAQQTFRSALSGIIREDVVRYIEFLNAQHAAEISQLNAELAFLRSKADQEHPAEAVDSEPDALVEQQAARIRELFDLCKEQEQQIEKLNAELAQAQQSNPKSCVEDELEAYRRAERTERKARERAEQVYHRVNGALADASAQVDDAATQIGQLADLAIAQLEQLRSAVTGSKDTLRTAAQALTTIRPTDDED